MRKLEILAAIPLVASLSGPVKSEPASDPWCEAIRQPYGEHSFVISYEPYNLAEAYFGNNKGELLVHDFRSGPPGGLTYRQCHRITNNNGKFSAAGSALGSVWESESYQPECESIVKDSKMAELLQRNYSAVKNKKEKCLTAEKERK